MARSLPRPLRIGPLDLFRSLNGDPLDIIKRAVREHGDPLPFIGPLGPIVLTGHPDGARAIFSADPDLFDIVGREQVAPFFGESSLLLSTGARHRRGRKLLTPPFHGARMRAYGETIADVTRRVAAELAPGRPFTMLATTQAISLEVILRAVLGVEGDERRTLFREAVARLTEAMASPAIAMFNFVRHDFGGIGPWARLGRTKGALDALIYEEIAARRANSAPREDILSLMMEARYDDGEAMSDKELRDELHLLLFAGHETTANALAWAFYWLHRQPDERERLLAEIEALGAHPEPDALAALPYLEAICQETLRIHPVVGEVGRLLRSPMEILGYEVPAGMGVMVSMLLLHDSEDLYPEPRLFRPARFLERKFSPFEFAPFGGGARRCIGAAFAMYEMKIVLATLLQAFRFRLVKDAPIRSAQRGVTHGPKGGVPMILEGAR
jgi:cytochrome P450